MVADGYDEIAVVGFSQGVLAARWAFAWFPETRDRVAGLIGIAGPSGGPAATALLGADTPLATALHQMTAGSRFLAALDEQWAEVSGFDVTLIASETDTVVAVDEVDAVTGATTVVVQDACPDREVDHVALAADAVVFAVELDALGQDGPGSADRLVADVCDGDSIAVDGWDADAVSDGAFGAIVSAHPVDDEPDLPGYATD